MKKGKLKIAAEDILLGVLLLVSTFLIRSKYLKGSSEILCNEYSAWGIIGNQLLLKVVTIILITMVFYLYIKEKNNILKFGWLIIFLGGLANLIERILYNCVTDYWKIFSWWPMFNLADVLITIGIFFLAINYLKLKHD